MRCCFDTWSKMAENSKLTDEFSQRPDLFLGFAGSARDFFIYSNASKKGKGKTAKLLAQPLFFLRSFLLFSPKLRGGGGSWGSRGPPLDPPLTIYQPKKALNFLSCFSLPAPPLRIYRLSIPKTQAARVQGSLLCCRLKYCKLL